MRTHCAKLCGRFRGPHFVWSSCAKNTKKHFFLNHLFGELEEKREATHVSLLKWTLCSGLCSAYCSQPSCYVTDNGSDPTTSSLPVVALGPATHRSSTTRLACWTRPDRTGPDQIGPDHRNQLVLISITTMVVVFVSYHAQS